MKSFQRIACNVVLLIGLVSTWSFAQSINSNAYTIVEGSVVVTPARCFQSPCPIMTATLDGAITVDITANRLLFPSSNLVTKPDVNFQLPQDPNEDSGGVVREATFEISNNSLVVKGFEDSRAFDGPLVEYKFLARVGNDNGGNFFTATPDLAQCAPPACGGYYVQAVNKKLTRCANGSWQSQCYVAEIIYNNTRLDNIGALNNGTPLLIQGSIELNTEGAVNDYGKLVATAAFRSATDQTAFGKFYGLENNGIVCITDPCFSYDEQLLNTKKTATKISQIDLDMSGASANDIEQAWAILASGGTLYATGKNRRYRGQAGKGVRFEAQQFYLPLKINPVCSEGYTNVNGACQTTFGCVFPLIEQTAYGGAPFKDPVTGQLRGSTSKRCVDQCYAGGGAGIYRSPGHCSVYMP